MSYNLTLQCGCIVYVACDPKSGLSHTRVIETKGPWCRAKRHEIGLRIYLWEIHARRKALLPPADPSCRP
jgi:hypothetical protein